MKEAMQIIGNGMHCKVMGALFIVCLLSLDRNFFESTGPTSLTSSTYDTWMFNRGEVREECGTKIIICGRTDRCQLFKKLIT